MDFYFYPWQTRLMFTCVLGRCVTSTVLSVPKTLFPNFVSTQTFLRAPTASVDSCAEIKSAPSVA